MRRPSLPYVTAPGNINKVLHGIQRLDVPNLVNVEFISEALDIRGSSARQMVLWLKRTGFVSAHETPTGLYARFHDRNTSGSAALDALRIGYAALYARNPVLHNLPDMEISALIMNSTGLGLGSNVVALTMASINALRAYAGLFRHELMREGAPARPSPMAKAGSGNLPDAKARSLSGSRIHGASALPDDVNDPIRSMERPVSPILSRMQGSTAFTIYLALPETADSAVLAAIFKSLKENLLGG